MAWINLPSISVTNGSEIVAVNDGTVTKNIKIGDALVINNYQPVEIFGVFADQLVLRGPWQNSNVNNASAVVMPTFGDFNAATQALRQAVVTTQGNFAELEKWFTQFGTIHFKGLDGSLHSARSFKQMDSDVEELEAKANDLVAELGARAYSRSYVAVKEAMEARKLTLAASGFIHTGTHYVHANGAYGTAVNEGLTCRWANTNYANTLWLGDLNDATYRVGESKTLYPLMNIAGHRVRLGLHYREVKFPQAPDGKVTFNKSTGVTTVHSDPAAAFAFAQGDTTGNTEVVINRVDMYGLEFWPREVTDGLYPFGDVQYQSASPINVPLTVNNDKPMSYFAAYPGDTSSRGTYWKLSELTFVQMAQVMNDPDTNAWYDESGKLIQFCFRQRTGLGAGNGDWGNIKPVSNDVLFNHGPIIKNRFSVQGELDDARVPSHANDGYFGSLSQKSRKELGVFSASPESPEVISLGNECYFYLLGTVPRLNQGAFHPSLNPMGAAEWIKQGDILGQWYLRPDFTKDTLLCFTPVTSATGSVGKRNTGKIGSTSGRPDGRFYDAIYASGQGGVIDWRLPARDMSGKEEAAKVFQKVVNGTYRGKQGLPLTKFVKGIDAEGSMGSGIYWNGADNPTGLTAEDVIVGSAIAVIYADGTSAHLGFVGYSLSAQAVRVVNAEGNEISVKRTSNRYMLTYASHISVSGNFTTLDVISPPEKILATPALASSWMGRWIHEIPKGVSQTYQLVRKMVTSGNTFTAPYTTNNGASWASQPLSIDGTTNSVTANWDGRHVWIVPYTAFAKQTKRSTNKPVFNGSEGLGDVLGTPLFNAPNGCLLQESLLGKVSTNDAPNSYWQMGVMSKRFYNDGKLASGGDSPQHEPLLAGTPNNNSPAVKALWHQASNNQQTSLNFLWNELVFDTDWRTPDKVWSGGSVSVAVGETFRAESSSAYAVAGLLMRCVKALTANATVLGAMHVSVGGDVISLSDGQTYFKVVNNGWSDDSTIRMIDGVGTFNNENGDTCLYGTDELAMPYGYTKNQAGAGKQVVGVDL
ncbi:TPA: hypothetical protein ACGUXT_000706 [Vibrio vulnificus]